MPTRGVKLARARFVATKRAGTRLGLVCVRLCMDLYEKFSDLSLRSYEYKYERTRYEIF